MKFLLLFALGVFIQDWLNTRRVQHHTNQRPKTNPPVPLKRAAR